MHVDRDVDEADALLHGDLVEVLAGGLLHDLDVADAPAADDGGLGGDRRARGEAEVRDPGGDLAADLAEDRLERLAVRGGQPAADDDAVDVLQLRDLDGSALGRQHRDRVARARGTESCGVLVEPLGAQPVVHEDHGDAGRLQPGGIRRPRRRLGQEPREEGGVVIRQAASDQVHTHPSTVQGRAVRPGPAGDAGKKKARHLREEEPGRMMRW